MSDRKNNKINVENKKYCFGQLNSGELDCGHRERSLSGDFN